MASETSSSMFSRPWNNDVFLSFRGEDTRKSFTDHVYTALVRSGIRTFRDDDELRRGEDISSALIKAIQQSRISLIVFSKRYASSRWCLDEVTEIINCKNTIGQIVIPIFYDVDPSDVRRQTGPFQQAFDRHEKRFREEMEKVKKWRVALEDAGKLSGFALQNMENGHESKFIEKIVEDVLSKLNYNYFDVAKHPVGIDSRVTDVISLLSLDINDVSIVGIHGMGGIGKTTIAKAVFNHLCHGFEGSSFLLNVREVSEQTNGLVKLQKQLLSDTLKSNKFKIYNIDSGISLIKQRLCAERVLVVLDDLDQLEQLDALVGEGNWFGLGSRIIITTRDEHLLAQLELVEKYKVNILNRDESLQLFSKHAFKKTHPLEEYVDLSNSVVDYVGGLPLGLEVLGSYLCNRTIPEWESAVQKLRKIPHWQIQKKLRISFDTLDDDKVKDIFLDIACFFTCKDKDSVLKILEDCGFFPEIGISVLIQRSLLTIDYENRLIMHDLLRDMGREIIREMSPNHPGKRSRLWFHEDVLKVLKRQEGTDVIEGIALDTRATKEVTLSIESFAETRNLRLLQINAVNLTGEQEHRFEDLRWLCWHECPFESLPPNLQLDNLVVLEMQCSNITEIWKDVKVLKKLKILDLSHSRHLAKTPNFSGLISLEKLILQGCTSLGEVHLSIGQLEKLVFLNLKGCKSLKDLPESICNLKSLEILNIALCTKLARLPEHLGNMESLTELEADKTDIKQLPSSIRYLKNLRNLFWSVMEDGVEPSIRSPKDSTWLLSTSLNSKALQPTSFLSSSSLTTLDLFGCGLSDDAISIDFGSLSSLSKLSLGKIDFCHMPSGISRLTKLRFLGLTSCRNIKSTGKLPSSLVFLFIADCESLERISLSLEKLWGMHLFGCHKLVEIQGLKSARKMQVYVK
ncbi:hypothetical protein JCGZ_11251 [Jatropha curcas]|uniref:TIR domain-containing protein n=1 Tax=Jatropha curcas TaxID=180498 RepID=A0A067KH97_JATCU|nr:hypothetical protein JCGZ_11251 [Jatropha curcas]